MGLFNKKKTESNPEYSCNLDNKTIKDTTQPKLSETYIKILGSGCKKCNELENATREALSSLGMNSTIEHITDFVQIATYGVMSTPALVINGKVVSYGKVLKKEDVINIIIKMRK